MIKKEFLDVLFHELYGARAKTAALIAIDTFAAIETKDGGTVSIDENRHSVALQAAQDRELLMDDVISKYLEIHK